MSSRYSKYLNPTILLVDLFIINMVVLAVYDKEYLNWYFLIYISMYWLVSTITTNYYKVYRNTRLYQLIRKLLLQSILLVLGYFTYFGFFREGVIVDNQTKILSLILFFIWFNKIIFFYGLRLYRSYGKNYRRTMVIGSDNSSRIIINTLLNDKDLGYIYLGNVIKTKENNIVNETKKFVEDKNIDEIFCSIQTVTKIELKKLTELSAKHNVLFKIIPNTTDIYSKKLRTEVYGNSIQVLTPIKLPLEQVENQFIKRLFDIIFSSLIIVSILSWLYPLLYILIKLESRGKVLFKQEREGVNGEIFLCYKFRSMYSSNKIDEGHTKKGDARVTKIGGFLRRTSLDEFPQFFNVILGHMSVVGPRPHMNAHSKKFSKEVANYMKRKSVKPGITGLAQVNGFRGEIRTAFDIENRVRYDVFYIKNWSFLLDIKIILQTFFNVFKGEEKAY